MDYSKCRNLSVKCEFRYMFQMILSLRRFKRVSPIIESTEETVTLVISSLLNEAKRAAYSRGAIRGVSGRHSIQKALLQRSKSYIHSRGWQLHS